MKRYASLALFSLLLTLLVSACGGGGTASLGSGDVLVVGGQNVSKDDLGAMMNRAKASYKANKQKFPKPGTQEFNSLQGQAVTYLLQLRHERPQHAFEVIARPHRAFAVIRVVEQSRLGRPGEHHRPAAELDAIGEVRGIERR